LIKRLHRRQISRLCLCPTLVALLGVIWLTSRYAARRRRRTRHPQGREGFVVSSTSPSTWNAPICRFRVRCSINAAGLGESIA